MNLELSIKINGLPSSKEGMKYYIRDKTGEKTLMTGTVDVPETGEININIESLPLLLGEWVEVTIRDGEITDYGTAGSAQDWIQVTEAAEPFDFEFTVYESQVTLYRPTGHDLDEWKLGEEVISSTPAEATTLNFFNGTYAISIGDKEEQVTVEAVNKPDFSIEIDNATVYLTAPVGKPDNTWDMGDGNLVNSLDSSDYTYIKDGTYTILLNGANAKTITIAAVRSEFDYSVDGLTVNVNTVSGDDEEFHFGDDEHVFIGASGSYTFSKSGTFQVYIKGGMAKDIKVGSDADFTWESTENQVRFFNPTGNTGAWVIDGVIYLDVDPIVELEDGSYLVTLQGANDQTVVIDDAPDVVVLPDFTYSINKRTVQFFNPDGLEGAWDLGNGNKTEEANPKDIYANGSYEITFTGANPQTLVVDVVDDIDYLLDGNVVTVTMPDDSEGMDIYYGDNTTSKELVHEFAQHGDYFMEIGTHQAVISVKSEELPILGDVSIEVGYPNSKTLTISFPDAPEGLDYVYIIDGAEYTSPVAVHEVVLPVDELSKTIEFSCRAVNDYGNASFYYQGEYEVLETNVIPTLDLFITKSAREITCSTVNVQDSDGTASDIKYSWDMGDEYQGVYLAGTSSTGDPVYRYAESGYYQDVTVTLTIWDARNGTSVYTKNLRIYDVEELDEPSLLANGDFATDDVSGFSRSSAAIEIVDNVLEITSTSGSSGRINVPLKMEVGELYKVDVEYWVENASNQAIKNFVGFTNNPTTALHSTSKSPMSRSVIYATAEQEVGNVSIYAGSTGNKLYVNEIKINKVL